ncbi:MAG TPA: cellulose binding domain-containing protein [Streptosporangiaceae bacterium]|jgi:hypothetical protein
MARQGRHSARRGGAAPTGQAAGKGHRWRMRHLLTPHFLLGVGAVGLAVAAYAGTHTYLDFHAGPDRASGCTGGCQHGAPQHDPTPEAVSRSRPPRAASVLRVRHQAGKDGGGFHAVVILTNTGTRPVSDWHLTYTYPHAKVRTASPARLWRGGRSPVLFGASVSRTIEPGETVRVRLSGDGVASGPYGCRLNGAVCHFV